MGRIAAFVLIVGAVIAAYAGWVYMTRMASTPAAVTSVAPQGAAAQSLRIIEAEGAPASCAAGEIIISAICYSGPGSSISASGPALREGEGGAMTAICLTGGRKLRLTCMVRR
jgi:hypothetical protein